MCHLCHELEGKHDICVALCHSQYVYVIVAHVHETA